MIFTRFPRVFDACRRAEIRASCDAFSGRLSRVVAAFFGRAESCFATACERRRFGTQRHGAQSPARVFLRTAQKHSNEMKRHFILSKRRVKRRFLHYSDFCDAIRCRGKRFAGAGIRPLAKTVVRRFRRARKAVRKCAPNGVLRRLFSV